MLTKITFRLATVTALAALALPLSAQTPHRQSSRLTVPAAHVPRPIDPPRGYRRALEEGTRTAVGRPGPRYWQQWAEYDLRASIDTEAKRLQGSARIRYHNNSPDTLDTLYVFLNQNLHAPGVPKSRPQEITGGVQLKRASIGGVELAEGEGYDVDGTVMTLKPATPIAPGAVARIEIDWAFRIPQSGASGRMGWSGDNLLFLAYWYPQLAVYNDVVGWQSDPFTGTAEFYAGFARYTLEIEAPPGWLVMATGTLQNANEVLALAIANRLQAAESSDEIVHVVESRDLDRGITRDVEAGPLSWRFSADSVRDVAFVVSRGSLWDAARTPLGDRDGDGEVDYARVDAIYRPAAFRWKGAVGYGQHAITFLSRLTGVPYPWPHMTAVEGAGIIGGGMEFPMMTVIGDYNERSDTALYSVIAHEFAHMWVPMMVNTDERRYSWMDEGTTRFSGHEALRDFHPDQDRMADAAQDYIDAARREDEGEVMRWSDHHYTYEQYRMASYAKPETLLDVLRSMLGEDTFMRAYRTYLRDWSFKHPYPWDMFSTLETVSGRDLDWFWRSWYYETRTLDQAVADVSQGEEGTVIVVANLGDVTMPAPLIVRRADGEELRLEIPVDVWLAGAREAAVRVPPGETVTSVEIDPKGLYPDIDRTNNTWSRTAVGAERGRGR